MTSSMVNQNNQTINDLIKQLNNNDQMVNCIIYTPVKMDLTNNPSDIFFKVFIGLDLNIDNGGAFITKQIFDEYKTGNLYESNGGHYFLILNSDQINSLNAIVQDNIKIIKLIAIEKNFILQSDFDNIPKK